jgi:hypothetical protein
MATLLPHCSECNQAYITRKRERFTEETVREIDVCSGCGYSVCNQCWPTSVWYKEYCGYCDHNQCNRCPKSQEKIQVDSNKVCYNTLCTGCTSLFHCIDCSDMEYGDVCIGVPMLPVSWWSQYPRATTLTKIT